MYEKQIENFNWEIYVDGFIGGQKLQPNKLIKEIKNTAKTKPVFVVLLYIHHKPKNNINENKLSYKKTGWKN